MSVFDKCSSCVLIIVTLLQLHQSATFPLDLYNFECTYREGSCHLLNSYILTTFLREFAFRAVYCDHEASPSPQFQRSAFDSPPFCNQDEPPNVIPFKSDYLNSLFFLFYLWSRLVLSFCSCRFPHCVTEFSARTLNKLRDVEKSGRTPLRTWLQKQCTEGIRIPFVYVHCFEANRVLKANGVKH